MTITFTGMGYRVDAKKTLFHYTVGWTKILKDYLYRCLRRSCIYQNHGLIDNLRVEFSRYNFIKFKKNGTVLMKLWMIPSDKKILIRHDLESWSFVTYLWVTYNIGMLICINCVLVLPLRNNSELLSK